MDDFPGEEGVSVSLTCGSLSDRTCHLYGCYCHCQYVFLLFGIHLAMVDPTHHAESVDQVPFIFGVLFQIALRLSHTGKCPCCIIMNEESGRPLLNFIKGLDI